MLISVIIPTFNVENYVSETIKTLLNQSNKNFEIIVIDDGSTDNTYNIICELLKNSEHKSYKIIKKNNGGVSSARNTGMSEASGEYLLFLDGDDYVSTDLINSVHNDINYGESDVICWKSNHVTDKKLLISSYSDSYNVNFENMTGKDALYNIIINKTLWIYTGSAVYKKILLQENNIRYSNGCINGEDQEFTFKALAKTSKVTFINKTLSYYVKRETSISNSYNIDKFQVIKALERAGEFIKKINNKDLNVIAEKIKYSSVVSNYFYSLDSCIGSLITNGYNTKKVVKQISNDLDFYYPGLKENTINIIKFNMRDNVRIKTKLRIYLVSPYLYVFLIKIKYIVKNY